MSLHLVETLGLFIHTNGNELDHRFDNAQAPLDFRNQLAVSVDREQNVVAVVELADRVGELATTQLSRSNESLPPPPVMVVSRPAINLSKSSSNTSGRTMNITS